MKYDAIIVGAGHNGLIAASYLAQRFKNILLLERRHIVGGAAQTEELYPGFKFSRFSYLCSLLRPSIVKELRLKEQGLKLYSRSISSITPTKERGKYLLMNNDLKFTQKEIAKFSQKDSQTYGEYCQFLSEVIDIWSYYQDRYPIDPGYKNRQGFNKKLQNTQQVYQMFKDGIRSRDKINQYLQLLGQSSSSLLNSWFESEILKATLVTDGIIGEYVSIDSPASAYVLLHHVMGEVEPESKGEWFFVEGGMGSISRILEQTALQRGVKIRTNAEVSRILTENGKANGVMLSDGTVFQSDMVISNCTPRVTFTQLMDLKELQHDVHYQKRIEHIEYNGACTKFNIAIEELPRFTCFQGTEYSNPADVLKGTVHIGCENLDYLRESYNQILMGNPFSKNLFIDLTIPTVHDKTLAPEGKHIVQCLVQYTPYKPSTWDDQTKQQLKEHVFNTINSYAPNFKESVLFTDMLTPKDLESILNLSEGNLFHGALNLDRLYSNRPAPGYNSYETPIRDLYLCGSGTHPGGGVMGSPGRNCANFILLK